MSETIEPTPIKLAGYEGEFLSDVSLDTAVGSLEKNSSGSSSFSGVIITPFKTQILSVPGYQNTMLDGTNSFGTSYGVAYNTDGRFIWFVDQNGKLTESTDQTNQYLPVGVDEFGDVALKGVNGGSAIFNHGQFEQIVVDGSASVQVEAVSEFGSLAGTCVVDGQTVGFVGSDGHYETFKIPSGALITGVSDEGDVVGSSFSSSFLFKGGLVSPFTLPTTSDATRNVTSISITGINDAGTVIGSFVDNGDEGTTKGFAETANGDLTILSVKDAYPGVALTYPSAINAFGVIAGNVQDYSNGGLSFYGESGFLSSTRSDFASGTPIPVTKPSGLFIGGPNGSPVSDFQLDITDQQASFFVDQELGYPTNFTIDNVVDGAVIGSAHFGPADYFMQEDLYFERPPQFFDSYVDGTISVSGEFPCFATGTLVETTAGQAAVEELKPGVDIVRLVNGDTCCVVWVGHRRQIDGQVVRVRKGALDSDTPNSDLIVSADHGFYLDGVLVQAGLLVNGASIVWEHQTEVTLWHVELERHGILIANGAPAESYLDTGNRRQFANCALGYDPVLDPAKREPCVEMIFSGARVDQIKAGLPFVALSF